MINYLKKLHSTVTNPSRLGRLLLETFILLDGLWIMFNIHNWFGTEPKWVQATIMFVVSFTTVMVLNSKWERKDNE